jgi:hypothetical protein
MRRTVNYLVHAICLLSVGAGCAKSDGSGGQGGTTGAGGGVAGGTTGSGGGVSGAAGTSGTGGTGVGTGGTGTGGTRTTGTAGRGAGGTSSVGGTTGAGGRAGSTGAGGTGIATSCSFTVMSSTSSKIATVGIVTWSTTLASPTSAHIDFGPDTNYGLTAPVDLTQTNYRTLLLGMKASRTYHFRVTAANASGSCVGNDNMITTGAAPNGLSLPTITTKNASALYGGFLVTGQYSMNVGAGAPAFILDKDGAYVWWYTVPNSDATGVTMSYDGNYMWINTANVPNSTAHVNRVSMDGLTDDDYSTQFAGMSHQLTVLPDETVAFYTYGTGTNGCDDIKLRSPSGTVTTVVNAKAAHGGSGACHVNAIFYSSSDDTLIFSDLDNNCLTKITRTGTTVWILNGGVGGITSTFNNGALVWKGGEHGFHILAVDDIVLFNNNTMAPLGSNTSWGTAAGDDSGSIALELKLDTTAKTATQVWSYKATNPAEDTMVLGDVQRLPNGNTMIDYATKGVIEEVDSSGNLLQTISTQTNFGYIQKRATLYGPPPR